MRQMVQSVICENQIKQTKVKFEVQILNKITTNSSLHKSNLAKHIRYYYPAAVRVGSNGNFLPFNKQFKKQFIVSR